MQKKQMKTVRNLLEKLEAMDGRINIKKTKWGHNLKKYGKYI